MLIDRRTLITSALVASLLPGLHTVAQDDPPWMVLAGDGSGPLGRWGHNLIVDPGQNRLLVVGGRDDAGVVKGDLWSFDLGSYAWATIDLSGPKARSGSAAAASPDGTGFYFFGGESDETVFDDLWWFDFATTTWQVIEPASGSGPSPRAGVRGVIDALGRFVISHGRYRERLFDDTWAFDPTSRGWTDISPVPELRPMARADHDLLSLPDYGVMLLTGGCSTGVGPCPQGDLWAFDVYGGSWVDITPYSGPTPRTGSAMARLGATILQVGGQTDLGAESDVWRGSFDGGTIGWQELTLVNHGPMGIYRRYLHDMAAAGTEFYVFGGEGVEGALGDLWAFSLERFTESDHSIEPDSDFDGAQDDEYYDDEYDEDYSE